MPSKVDTQRDRRSPPRVRTRSHSTLRHAGARFSPTLRLQPPTARPTRILSALYSCPKPTLRNRLRQNLSEYFHANSPPPPRSEILYPWLRESVPVDRVSLFPYSAKCSSR